ncbi:hypothetical protein SLEP1_g53242 [Rubroshorea leprosula]|uniref:Leucine-rich repeat-containing N-terminal plant-type domain-containing protein n=1 Tax=Rubroshorea leprosula TaxID=152421 RepID=A0AAV5M9T2_9ROSI|nr:hypothetical protein SLEP1_g53242 [Rubroshorea leprosula]
MPSVIMAKAGIYAAVFLFCILQCKFCSFAMLDPLDFLALQSIRKSLDDLTGSNFFASWDFTLDPCNFPGVYCDSERVIAFNLGNPKAGSLGLIGKIDPAIRKLSALAKLSTVPGRIVGSLPQSTSFSCYQQELHLRRDSGHYR